MSRPRICIDCTLRTVKLICPRCGGQTDEDEYGEQPSISDNDASDDEDWDDDILDGN